MNGKLNVLLTFAIALLVLLLFSCNENNLVESELLNKNNYEEGIHGDSVLGKFPCNFRKFQKWEVVESESYYVPAAGKKLGFNYTGFATPGDMKNKYGFSKVLIKNSTHKNSANAAGFLNTDIVYQIDRRKLNYISGLGSYYLDEPSENYVDINDVIRLASYVYPGRLLLSSYKISVLDPFNKNQNYYSKVCMYSSNVEIMSDNYYGAYIPGLTSNQDQRGYWDDFQDRYGSRNKSNWISLIIDGKPSRGDGDYHDLLGWANNNRFNEMWLYIGNADDDHPETLTQSKFDALIKEFLTFAKYTGWLDYKEKQKLYSYTYICTLPCDLCDQEDILSMGWKLTSRVYTGQNRIVTYSY